MAEQFYTILTNTGKAKWVAAIANGTTINIEKMALGSGENEAYYNPVEAQVALKNEVWRGLLSSTTVPIDNPNWLLIEAVVLATDGGFNVREVGIIDTEGDLIAIGKFPETYKPQYADGSTKDLWIRVYLEVSNASVVNFNVDPSTASATLNTVVQAVSAHNLDLNSHDVLLGTATPLMDGAAAVGTSNKRSREDHKHPTDTSRAPIDSPSFTGIPATPTATAGTNTLQVANTAFVQAAITALINGSPTTLDTLKELADALADDANFATTIITMINTHKSSLTDHADIRALTPAHNIHAEAHTDIRDAIKKAASGRYFYSQI